MLFLIILVYKILVMFKKSAIKTNLYKIFWLPLILVGTLFAFKVMQKLKIVNFEGVHPAIRLELHNRTDKSYLMPLFWFDYQLMIRSAQV